MTGYGDARLQTDRWSVAVEVRTVNNRHFKLNAKVSEPFAALEPELEKLVRETVRRGTVTLQVRVERPRRPEDYRINTVALTSYRDQVVKAFGPAGAPADLGALLALPGVVEERRPSAEDPNDEWPELAAVINQALRKLQAARTEEGRAMADEMLALAASVSEQLERISARAPEVVNGYQKRLTERVQGLVVGQDVTIEPKDLIREIAILAERADIAEEIVRLRAHLTQFVEVINESESNGRKLEFVVQEMGRETNTIGSKANDVEISRGVVEIKGLLEKVRELIQNVE
jgi:uncharacterized protein (TIGR00255 family)